MPQTLTLDREAAARNLFGTPEATELFAAIDDPQAGAGRAALEKIAAKIGRTRRPGAKSDIPAGAHLSRPVRRARPRLPDPRRRARHRHARPRADLRRRAEARRLLLPGAARGRRPRATCSGSAGRGRPRPRRPGAPRATCRAPPARASTPARSRPAPRCWCRTASPIRTCCSARCRRSGRSCTTPSPRRSPRPGAPRPPSSLAAAHQPRHLPRGDPPRRARHLADAALPRPLRRRDAAAPRRQPSSARRAEFMAGVGRLGHGLVREVYSLNDQNQVMGLRNLVRHTSTGRPHDMPLTEDWLVDFSRFFAIGSSVPQRARALGPHVARPFATGMGVGTDGSADGLVLRDLVACTRGGLRSVRSLIARATQAEPRLFEGCFAQDETTWIPAVAEWLADTGLAPDEVDRLASDPPLTLFLMLEAEADTGGKSLGAPRLGHHGRDARRRAAGGRARQRARRRPRRGVPRPRARHHGRRRPLPAAPLPLRRGRPPARARRRAAAGLADARFRSRRFCNARHPSRRQTSRSRGSTWPTTSRWAGWSPSGRPTRPPGPTTVEELKEQLDGIAVVPDRIKTVEIVQSTLDHLILRLPVKEMIEESLERMSDPMGDGTLSAAAVLRRLLPPRVRAGDDPARHPARPGRRLHHCPVPLRRRPGLTPQPLRPVALPP